jgi:hypothetical protein
MAPVKCLAVLLKSEHIKLLNAHVPSYKRCGALSHENACNDPHAEKFMHDRHQCMRLWSPPWIKRLVAPLDTWQSSLRNVAETPLLMSAEEAAGGSSDGWVQARPHLKISAGTKEPNN